MKDTVNTYLAILLITIVGSGAALLIVDIGTADAIESSLRGSEAKYAELRQSILNNR